MNYPVGTIVQNYLVATGRVIQLPCFFDQEEPSDGFRAIVFDSFNLGGGDSPNQLGPPFTDNTQPCAVMFDFSALVPSQMSRVRSVALTMYCGAPTGGVNTSSSARLLLDSGFAVPISRTIAPYDGSGITFIGTDSFTVCDFITAVPQLAVWSPSPAVGYTGVLTVANFALSASQGPASFTSFAQA